MSVLDMHFSFGKGPSRACVAWPALGSMEVRVVAKGKVAKDEVDNDVHPDEQVEHTDWSCLRGVAILPLELIVAFVNEGLDVVVTLGHRIKTLPHELILSVGRLTNEVGSEWIAHLVDTELDRAVADTRLHLLKHQSLHDDVDCAEDVRSETEVPVGPGVGKVGWVVGLVPEEHADEGSAWAGHSGEHDPVLDAQSGTINVVAGHREHE